MFPVQNSVNEKIQSFFDYPNVHKIEEVLLIFFIHISPVLFLRLQPIIESFHWR